jgi:hypothetical protein
LILYNQFCSNLIKLHDINLFTKLSVEDNNFGRKYLVNFLQKMPEMLSSSLKRYKKFSGDHPIYESVRDVNRHVIERLLRR